MAKSSNALLRALGLRRWRRTPILSLNRTRRVIARSIAAGETLEERAARIDDLVARRRIDPVHGLLALTDAARRTGWLLLPRFPGAPRVVTTAPGLVRRVLRRTVERSVGIHLSGRRVPRAAAIAGAAPDELRYVMVDTFRQAARLLEAGIDTSKDDTAGSAIRPLIVGTCVGDARRLDLRLSLPVSDVEAWHAALHDRLRGRFTSAHLTTQPLPKSYSKGRARMGDPEMSALAAAVLRRIDDAFRMVGTGYVADFGTLLGAVRDGAPIPWDDDLDLVVQGPLDVDDFLAALDLSDFEVEVVLRHLNTSALERFGLTSPTQVRKLILGVARRGERGPSLVISMPVAHRDPTSGEWWYRSMRNDVRLPAGAFAESSSKAVQRVPFLGSTIPIPEGAEMVLEERYGQGWPTPSLAWGPYTEVLESRR